MRADKSVQQSKLLQAFHSLEETNRRIDLDRNNVSLDFKDLLVETLRGLDQKTSQRVWAEKLRLLPPEMARTAVMSRQITEEQRFLKSLKFDEVRRRWADVASAHHKTFKWIFEDTASVEHGNMHIGFKAWLLNGSGHFWIEGKAGSGKSTLMKFICEHPRTEKYLSTWASSENKSLVTAKFFFWHSGTPLEKSQEGLLRSLLFEILSKCPDLIRKVQPEDMAMPDASNIECWTNEELFSVFHRLTTQRLPFRFCIFIDGLDEYGGHHTQLIETLRGLLSLPDVKICVSSRPWRPFREAFGEPKEQTIRIQDLTRGDIRSYISDKFMRDRSFQSMAAQDPQAPNLIEEVMTRAEGVFLWVFLVVRSLLDGIHERDLISGLWRRLEGLPRNLEDFFRHMISQIDDSYLRSQTVETFQIALASPEPPLLAVYSIVDDLQGRKPRDPSQVTLETYEKMNETMETRLDARCKGLLEVSKTSTRDPFLEHKVVFLHRTVRDFLIANIQQIFGEQVVERYNANFALCEAIGLTVQVAAINGLKDDADTKAYSDLVEQLFYHSYEVEIHQPTAELAGKCSKILEDTEAALLNSTWWKWRRKNAAFVGTAVEWDLRHFVKKQITDRPGLMKTRQRPLLDHALLPDQATYVYEALRSAEMVNMLLEAKANPNTKFNDATIWTRFLQLLKDHKELANDTCIIDITKNLLQAGADPCVTLVKKERYTINASKRKLTGRGSDLYKRRSQSTKIGTRVVEVTKLDDLMKELFGSERYAFIMSARPPNKTTAWQILSAVWSRDVI